MVRITNMDGEEEVRIMKPESPAGIYATTSVESQCRLIAQNRKMKEEEKIKKHKGKCSEKGRPYESAR